MGEGDARYVGGRATDPRSRSVEAGRRQGGDPPSEGGLTRLVERVLPIAVLVMAVVGAPVLIFSPQGLPRLRGLEKELADVDDENAELRRDIEALRGQVERLRDDPAAVERIARDDLGLVRQSEVVFQFSPKR